MEDIKYCKRCGRRLKSAEAIERGYGKVCFLKAIEHGDKRALFQYEQENPVQTEKLRKVISEMGIDNSK